MNLRGFGMIRIYFQACRDSYKFVRTGKVLSGLS